ncbi:MAG TPA: flavin-nucleotide-binding protein [Gammaproteobacteria bacterium]|nr:flavin-nucleotide-binding protein [Gammaproteobacteria bacterium]
MRKHAVYHDGEIYLQKRSGVEAIADKLSEIMITDNLSRQQQMFYALLNTLFVASVDKYNRPWASIMTGSPGFLSTPDEKHLKINAPIIAGDCLKENIEYNAQLGFLGLEHHTRRRNRMAGELITHNENSLLIRVNQALGNCSKYIQARKSDVINSIAHTANIEVEEYSIINETFRALISKADTFFIASYHPHIQHRGADISHRGGKPGFVRIENDDTLIFNDYAGNNLYMTLGNLYSHPYAGLLFIDYSNSDLWQIQCEAKIIETPHRKHSRVIKLKISRIIKISSALNIEWQLL